LPGRPMPATGLMGSRLDRPRPVGVAPGAAGAGERRAAGLAGSCYTRVGRRQGGGS